ncbi:hypothetical protein OBBRIDRAFT_825761, partial [Obba rivulosa]
MDSPTPKSATGAKSRRRKASRRRTYPQAHTDESSLSHSLSSSATSQPSQSAPQIGEVAADITAEDSSEDVQRRTFSGSEAKDHNPTPLSSGSGNPSAIDK